jgi:hypothetical protein
MNDKYSLIQDNVSLASNEDLRKTNSMSNNQWKKNELSDSASFLSFQDVVKDKNGH